MMAAANAGNTSSTSIPGSDFRTYPRYDSMNIIKQLARLLAVLFFTLLTVGCAATGITPNTANGRDPGLGSSNFSRVSGTTNTVPGFYFYNGYIIEYARNAAGNTPPLRQLLARGGFFGADKAGNVYSYTNTGNLCPNPCQVLVSNALGKQHHEVTLPTLGLSSAISPSSLFVDQNGSIYYMLDCIRIVQLPAGATGSNPKPARTINIPAYACGSGNRNNIKSQFFATTDGNLFMNGPYNSTAAYYNWPATASGRTKPRVIITGIAQKPILGIDSKGNAWTIGFDPTLSACKIAPNASGRITPACIVLQGISANTLGMLRVSSKDQLVYEGFRGPSKNAVLRISSLLGGTPTRQLNLPQGFIGNELTSITF